MSSRKKSGSWSNSERPMYNSLREPSPSLMSNSISPQISRGSSPLESLPKTYEISSSKPDCSLKIQEPFCFEYSLPPSRI